MSRTTANRVLAESLRNPSCDFAFGMLSRVLSRHLRYSCGSYYARLVARRPNITRPNSTKATDNDKDDKVSIEQFGSYIPVLSDNPLAFGTSHIMRKSVPAHIKLPPYARPNYRADRPPPYRGNGLVKLGTDDEHKARRAGALAAMVLNKAGSLIRVRKCEWPGTHSMLYTPMIARYYV